MTGNVSKSCDVALVLLTTNSQGNVAALRTMSIRLNPLSVGLGEPFAAAVAVAELYGTMIVGMSLGRTAVDG